MANAKVIFGSEVLIDLTNDTVEASKVLDGYTFHDHTGEEVEGTCAYDADTSDATAVHGEILNNKTAYVNGVKVTGDMPNNGAVSGTISTKAGQYTVPAGYHDGSGKVQISSTEQAKIIAGNIKSGIQILGVTGTYGGEVVRAQAKNATPSLTSQTILPDSGYDYLSQVVVAGIPVERSTLPTGGTLVKIG